MLKVFAIQSKKEQEEICRLCDVPYQPDLLAYGASVDDRLVGVCQFILRDGKGILYHLAPKKGADDFEALFVLGRATLNFIDLCGVKQAVCLDSGIDPSLARSIGFSRREDGTLFVDLNGFFDHPCQH